MSVPEKPTRNLRLQLDPYPHLRDSDGCVLARDFFDERKLKFILRVVAAAEQRGGGAD